jgi:hypothetical protein
MEQELKIPEGWEFSRVEGDKIILKEGRPKTWEDCVKKVGSKNLAYISSESQILEYSHKERGFIKEAFDSNLLPKKYVQPMLALAKLLVCYKAWANTYVPDWTNPTHDKYGVCVIENRLRVVKSEFTSKLFTFSSESKCKEFLAAFESLLEQAKPLL